MEELILTNKQLSRTFLWDTRRDCVKDINNTVIRKYPDCADVVVFVSCLPVILWAKDARRQTVKQHMLDFSSLKINNKMNVIEAIDEIAFILKGDIEALTGHQGQMLRHLYLGGPSLTPYEIFSYYEKHITDFIKAENPKLKVLIGDVKVGLRQLDIIDAIVYRKGTRILKNDTKLRVEYKKSMANEFIKLSTLMKYYPNDGKTLYGTAKGYFSGATEDEIAFYTGKSKTFIRSKIAMWDTLCTFYLYGLDNDFKNILIAE